MAEKGIIIDVGFVSRDLQEYINKIKKEFESVDFGDAIGLEKAFKEQAKIIREQLDKLKNDIANVDSASPTKLEEQFNDMSKTVNALSQTLRDIKKQLPGIKLNDTGISDMAEEAEELANNVKNAGAAITEIQRSVKKNGATVQVIDRNEVRKEISELQKLKDEIDDAIHSSEQLYGEAIKNKNGTDPKNTAQNQAKLLKAVTDRTKQYQEVNEKIIEINKDSTLSEEEKVIEIEKLNIQLLEHITYISRVVSAYEKMTETTFSLPDNALFPNKKKIEEEYDFIFSILEEESKELEEQLLKGGSTKEVAKNIQNKLSNDPKYQLSLPLKLSDNSDEKLEAEVKNVITTLQKTVSKTPLQLEVMLVSKYKTQRSKELLEQLNLKLDENVDDEQIKNQIRTLVTNIEKYTSDDIQIHVRAVGEERVKTAVKELLDSLKQKVEEVNKDLTIYPSIDFKQEEIDKIQEKIQKLAADGVEFDIRLKSDNDEEIINQEDLTPKFETLSKLFQQITFINMFIQNFVDNINNISNSFVSQFDFINDFLPEEINMFKDLSSILNDIHYDFGNICHLMENVFIPLLSGDKLNNSIYSQFDSFLSDDFIDRIDAVNRSLTELSEKAKKNNSPIQVVFNNENISVSEESIKNEKEELNNLATILSKDIPEAINDKDAAFIEEGSIVSKVVDGEISDLNRLKDAIKEAGDAAKDGININIGNVISSGAVAASAGHVATSATTIDDNPQEAIKRRNRTVNRKNEALTEEQLKKRTEELTKESERLEEKIADANEDLVEVTDFYDSNGNLMKTLMKTEKYVNGLLEKRSYTTGYDYESGNSFTSWIDSTNYRNADEIVKLIKLLEDLSEAEKRVDRLTKKNKDNPNVFGQELEDAKTEVSGLVAKLREFGDTEEYLYNNLEIIDERKLEKAFKLLDKLNEIKLNRQAISESERENDLLKERNYILERENNYLKEKERLVAEGEKQAYEYRLENEVYPEAEENDKRYREDQEILRLLKEEGEEQAKQVQRNYEIEREVENRYKLEEQRVDELIDKYIQLNKQYELSKRASVFGTATKEDEKFLKSYDAEEKNLLSLLQTTSLLKEQTERLNEAIRERNKINLSIAEDSIQYKDKLSKEAEIKAEIEANAKLESEVNKRYTEEEKRVDKLISDYVKLNEQYEESFYKVANGTGAKKDSKIVSLYKEQEENLRKMLSLEELLETQSNRLYDAFAKQQSIILDTEAYKTNLDNEKRLEEEENARLEHKKREYLNILSIAKDLLDAEKKVDTLTPLYEKAPNTYSEEYEEALANAKKLFRELGDIDSYFKNNIFDMPDDIANEILDVIDKISNIKTAREAKVEQENAKQQEEIKDNIIKRYTEEENRVNNLITEYEQLNEQYEKSAKLIAEGKGTKKDKDFVSGYKEQEELLRKSLSSVELLETQVNRLYDAFAKQNNIINDVEAYNSAIEQQNELEESEKANEEEVNSLINDYIELNKAYEKAEIALSKGGMKREDINTSQNYADREKYLREIIQDLELSTEQQIRFNEALREQAEIIEHISRIQDIAQDSLSGKEQNNADDEEEKRIKSIIEAYENLEKTENRYQELLLKQNAGMLNEYPKLEKELENLIKQREKYLSIIKDTEEEEKKGIQLTEEQISAKESYERTVGDAEEYAIKLVDAEIEKREESNTQLTETEKAYKKLIAIEKQFQKSAVDSGEGSEGTASQIATYKSLLKIREKLLKEIENSRKNIDKETQSVQDLDAEYTKVSQEAEEFAKNLKIGNALNKLNGLINKLDELRDSGKLTQSSMALVSKDMEKATDVKINNANSVDYVNDLNNAIENLESTLDQVQTKANKISINKLLRNAAKTLNDNSAMSKKLKVDFNALINELKELKDDSVISEEIVKKFAERFTELEAEMQLAGDTGKSFWQRMAEGARNAYAQFFAFYFGLNDVTQYFREAISYVVDLDSALTELRVVSGNSATELKNMANSAFNVAQSIGSTTTEVVESTTAWRRLGYTIEESSKLAEAAAMLSTGGFMDVSVATEALTSTLQAFDEIDVNNITDAVDSYIYLGNNYAITSEELATSLERSSAALVAANNSFAEVQALEIAGNCIA